MFGDFLNISDHGVSFFILVFLAKTEAKVQEEEDLNKVIKKIKIESFRKTKGRVECLSKHVIHTGKKHE